MQIRSKLKECKFYERALFTFTILIAFSTVGIGGKKEGRKGKKEGGKEGDGRKERSQCINYGLVPYLKFQIFLLLKEWQNKCFICNFQIAFIPF